MAEGVTQEISIDDENKLIHWGNVVLFNPIANRIQQIGIASFLLVLSACGGSDGPRLSLPLTAPENANPLIRDFIDICSQAIDDPVSAAALAKVRGWTFDGAMGGVSAFTNPELDGVLQIMEFDYPHVETRNCMVNISGDIPADLEVERIGDIAGVQGELLSLPAPTSASDEATESGRWSFISEADQVVTITTTQIQDRFIILNMSTARRVTPDRN